MVARLRGAGIRDEAVLAAMLAVPRHEFVDEALASRAYEDTALPIGSKQTISQPFVVARAAVLLREAMRVVPGKAGKILEIGTGCGYQAAILSRLFDEVVSIERIKALHDLATKRLRPLQLANLKLVYGDGMLGAPEAAPFDGIVSAAAAEHVPQALLGQLALGGVLVMPVGTGQQRFCVVTRVAPHRYQTEAWDAVRFVPMLAGLE